MSSDKEKSKTVDINIEFIESEEGERSATYKQPPTIFIAVDNVIGGFATQHITRIAGLAFCKRFGFVYVNTQMSVDTYLKYEHDKITSTNKEIKGWLNLWDYILNYNEGSVNETDIDYEIKIDLTKENPYDFRKYDYDSDEYSKYAFDTLNQIYLCRKRYPKDRILFVINDPPELICYSQDFLSRFQSDLKDSYGKTPGPSLFYDVDEYNGYKFNTEFNVAIHKRHIGKYKKEHPDKNANIEMINRIVGLDAILKKTLARYKEIHGTEIPQKKIRFWIFTDGLKKDYPEFKFHPKKDILGLIPGTEIIVTFVPFVDSMKTFHHLVSAEVLMMEKCSFSYLAGLFANNLVYYNAPFKYPKLHDWKELSMIDDEYGSMLENKKRQVMNDDGTPNMEAISYVIEQALKSGDAQIETTGTDSNGNPLTQEQIADIIKNTMNTNDSAKINVNGQPLQMVMPQLSQQKQQSTDESESLSYTIDSDSDSDSEQQERKTTKPTTKNTKARPAVKSTAKNDKDKTPSKKPRKTNSKGSKDNKVELVAEKPKKRGRPRKNKD